MPVWVRWLDTSNLCGFFYAMKNTYYKIEWTFKENHFIEISVYDDYGYRTMYDFNIITDYQVTKDYSIIEHLKTKQWYSAIGVDKMIQEVKQTRKLLGYE